MGLGNQETRKKELFVTKKNVYERALPILVQEPDVVGQLAMHSEFNVQRRLKELSELVLTFKRLSQYSLYPYKICGRRTACFCGFKSLFHETKQMGIVLRKAFKGSHVWITPIKDQLKEGESPLMKLNLDSHTNPVKIDAMLFTATEEDVVLVGDDQDPLHNVSDFHTI